MPEAPTPPPPVAIRWLPVLRTALLAALLLALAAPLGSAIGAPLTIALLAGIGGLLHGLLARPPAEPVPPPLPQPSVDDTAIADAERNRAIVATATEGIVTIDHRGSIESMNGAAERMFDIAATQAIGQNVAILMPQPWAAEHDGYLERYLASGEKRIIGIGREVLGRRRDGSTFPIDLSVGEGKVGDRRFFVAITRDISERKELQAKLSQTERLAAIGELAAGVAHEVNNPLNTMINCAQLILDGDDARENAQAIREEGERVASIVKDLLQFARQDDQAVMPTSITDVVGRTLRLLGENFKRHGIRLELNVPDDLPPVRARVQQLQQVLLNLLINAKDALQQEPGMRDRCIRILAVADGAGVALSVADNGPGVSAQLGERVFEPFVTTKRARGGTGLGLSISRTIVQGFGGTLTLRPDAGPGATFCAWLPRADESV